MPLAYISIGSNIEPEKNVKEALRLLSVHSELKNVSTVYETEPERGRKDPWYYNCVAVIDTDLRPEDLKYNLLLRIEKSLGRTRNHDKFASRTIDLDLIAFEGMKFKSAGFTLPDPDIHRRPYLRESMREVAPHMPIKNHETYGVPPLKMEALKSYSKRIRKDFLNAE